MYRLKLKHAYQYPSMKESDLDLIVTHHIKRTFKKGDLLLSEGQISDSYYIVEQGIVRSFVFDYQGNDITTSFFCEDELVIEVASIFHRIPTKENIICLTDCILWEIKFSAFQELYESIPALTEWGRAWMSFQLLSTKKRTLDIICLSAVDRYKILLKEKPQILQQAPLKFVASYLGITDTSLSRIRKELVTR